MFSSIPNGYSKRNMARFGRAFAPGTVSRADPVTRLRLEETDIIYIELVEIENIIFTTIQKEKNS